MKVTVCFGNDVRIVIPCGNGDLLVGELMNDAAIRYKKNTNKFDVNVIIHHLMLADGGILDEGDHVLDVVDDKDQLYASFEEDGIIVFRDSSNPSISIILNDSKSGGGKGKGDSPSFHINSRSSPDNLQLSKKDGSNTDFNCNWMTDTNVMRNNSPQSNEVMDSRSNEVMDSRSNGVMTNNPTSVIPGQHLSPVLKKILNKKPKKEAKKSELSGGEEKEIEIEESNCLDCLNSTPNSNRSTEMFNSFIRDSSRKSLSNQLVMSKWLDAQERMQDSYEDRKIRNSEKSQNEIDKRILQSPHFSTLLSGTGSLPFRSSYQNGFASPLPSYQSLPIKKKRQAPDPPFLPPNDSQQVLPPCHLHPHLDNSTLFSNDVSAKEEEGFSLTGLTPDSNLNLIVPEFGVSSDDRKLSSDFLTTTFEKQSTSANVARSKLTPSKKGVLAPTNTRLIGNKIVIQLKKGANGLGFSITTRDNVAGHECPIYIKNILPVGSAVDDGHLRAGDRLLEVNGIKMTGKTQTAAANVLRSIPVDASVDLLVSRHVTDDEDIEQKMFDPSIRPNESNDAPHDVILVDQTVTIKNDEKHERQIEANDEKTFQTKSFFTFSVPLNFSNLGFNVKNVCHDGRDLGIFVGSASKEGDLRINDQLIEINGVSLHGLSNSKAINILRSAMQTDRLVPGYLTVTVCRSKGNQFPFVFSEGFQEILENSSEKTDDTGANVLIHLKSDKRVVGSIENQVSDDGADNLLDSNFRDEKKNNEEMIYRRNIRETENKARNLANARFKSEADNIKVSETNGDFSQDEKFDEVDSNGVFAREGFGRQSISEKRKGHVDPSSLIVYQKIKETKEKMISYDSATWDPRKSTFHKTTDEKFEDHLEKKSKSLEDLNIEREDIENNMISFPGNNESFRVAIDRLYDSPIPGKKNINAIGAEPKMKESILTLSKASLFSNFWKSEKKKNDMDKIRNILKKGTDILRFSKRRKSVEKRDDFDSSLEANKHCHILTTNDQSKSNAVGSEPRLADTFPVNGGGAESGDLEITHFGAECITRVVKDGKIPNVKETSNEFEMSKDRTHVVETNNAKLQQLRMEHRRQHKQRNGRYPLDNIEDEFEKWRHEQDQEEEIEPLNVTYPRPPPRRSLERSRPKPITTQPEISAQLEDPPSSSSAQYLLDNRHHPYLLIELRNNYEMTTQPSVLQSQLSSVVNVHSRQTSSPLPSRVQPLNHERSSSELIPIVTNHCFRTSYEAMSRLTTDYGGGGIVTQSSHV